MKSDPFLKKKNSRHANPIFQMYVRPRIIEGMCGHACIMHEGHCVSQTVPHYIFPWIWV